MKQKGWRMTTTALAAVAHPQFRDELLAHAERSLTP